MDVVRILGGLHQNSRVILMRVNGAKVRRMVKVSTPWRMVINTPANLKMENLMEMACIPTGGLQNSPETFTKVNSGME